MGRDRAVRDPGTWRRVCLWARGGFWGVGGERRRRDVMTRRRQSRETGDRGLLLEYFCWGLYFFSFLDEDCGNGVSLFSSSCFF